MSKVLTYPRVNEVYDEAKEFLEAMDIELPKHSNSTIIDPDFCQRIFRELCSHLFNIYGQIEICSLQYTANLFEFSDKVAKALEPKKEPMPEPIL